MRLLPASLSQTEGKELPDIAVDELTGDVDRYKDFFAALEKTSPVPIAFAPVKTPALPGNLYCQRNAPRPVRPDEALPRPKRKGCVP